MWMTEDCMRSNLMSFTFSCHDRRLFLTTIFCHRHSTSFSLKLYGSLWFYPGWIKGYIYSRLFWVLLLEICLYFTVEPLPQRWELGRIKWNLGWMENFIFHIMKFLIVCYLVYKIIILWNFKIFRNLDCLYSRYIISYVFRLDEIKPLFVPEYDFFMLCEIDWVCEFIYWTLKIKYIIKCRALGA